MSSYLPSAEELAQRFHETYERLAPQFGYETRKESAKPWHDVPAGNRALMTAVCQEIIDYLDQLNIDYIDQLNQD